MKPTHNQPPTYNNPSSSTTPSSIIYSNAHETKMTIQYVDDYEQQMQEDILKNETFYECTQSQQKIWRLFNSLDCSQCGKMYNNRERKPHIICANNHLLCKSCYSKIRQSSLLCPFCHVRISHKSSSSHESIQLFLKIYNEIFEKQKTMIEQKRKRTYLDFEIPKNLKTLVFLLLIIVTPWIYDGIKILVCWIVEMQYRLMMFLLDQVAELVNVVKIVLKDEFYIGLYTNENGEYVYHGEDALKSHLNTQSHHNASFIGNAYSTLYTQRHRAKIDTYMKLIHILGYCYTRMSKIATLLYQTLRILTYITHFLILIIGVVQMPFLVPIILVRLQVFFPRRYIYRVGLYLDIVQPEETDPDYYLEPEEIERLSKFQLYFLLSVRNYIRYMLRLYKTVEVDMKKRCEELEYKRRMRLLKKNQKETTNSTAKTPRASTVTKTKMRFSFDRIST